MRPRPRDETGWEFMPTEGRLTRWSALLSSFEEAGGGSRDRTRSEGGSYAEFEDPLWYCLMSNG